MEIDDHEANIERLLIRADQSRLELRRSNIMGSANKMQRVLPSTPSYKSTALIWDTRASFGLTSFRCDLVDCVECDIPLKDITKINRVVGIGTTLHKFQHTNGDFISFLVFLTIY